MKADMKLEIDEQGLEARVTLTPSPRAGEVTGDRVIGLLREKGVKEGIVPEVVEKAIRALQRKPGEPLTFTVARGLPPRPTEPEAFIFEAPAVPSRLQAIARDVLARAKPPEAFAVKERKVKKKKIVKKAALPFLSPKETVEEVWGKQLVRERVTIDPTVQAVGFVQKGSPVARVKPGKQGKEGRSIFGRLVPPPKVSAAELYLGEGLSRSGSEIKAEATGFLRRGSNWCDLVPFRDHELELSASADKQACFLSFTPGDRTVPLPNAAEVLERAQKLGVPKESLLGAGEIERILREASESNAAVTKLPITPSSDSVISVEVSLDKLRATLTLKKGSGAGKKLILAEVSDAIRKSGVRGFEPEKVKKDLMAFYNSPQTELSGYLLAEGKPPEQGEDGSCEWLVTFAKAEEMLRVKEQSLANQARLADLKSLADFPLAAVEAVAWVKAGEEILRLASATVGQSGMNVYRALIPGLKGKEPDIRIFEGLKRSKEAVVATVRGLLERGTREGAILLRVRSHRDADLQVALAEDRMRGFVMLLPAEGTGKSLSADELKAKLTQGGIVRGLNAQKLQEVLAALREGRALKDFLVAEGKPPKQASARKVAFQVRLATGASVTVGQDGRADFRNQDKVTSVRKGELIATLSPPQGAGEDGWDVAGKPIRAGKEKEQAISAGKGVRAVRQPDGSVRFIAELDGELFHERNLLEVKQVQTINGDVDFNTGNVKVTGVARITGTVLSGFSVEAGDDVMIDGTVQGAAISAGGSISIRQGVKGESKAVLRAKKNISTLFAEQATIECGGDVHMRSACVRCQVTCNGRFTLDSEKGNLMGGRVRARHGITVQNLGSPSGARTEVSFGQDYQIKGEIEQEEKRIAELEARIRLLDKSGADRRVLETSEKRESQESLERHSRRLSELQQQFTQSFPAEVEVRGTLHPGAILESHGRIYESKTEKRLITLRYDPVQRSIVQKL